MLKNLARRLFGFEGDPDPSSASTPADAEVQMSPEGIRATSPLIEPHAPLTGGDTLAFGAESKAVPDDGPDRIGDDDDEYITDEHELAYEIDDSFHEYDVEDIPPNIAPSKTVLQLLRENDSAKASGDEEGAERRSFVMHENLLRDVIQRQAGSLAKAVLEGVMNLIEAGATKGSVTITSDRVVIADNGRGFETRDEVLEAFEVFGKSDTRRAIAGRWAEFQMGRGQLMAFGRTIYRTRTFEMETNIQAAQSAGIGYTLRADLPDVPGCTVTVELYNELEGYELQDVVSSVARVIKYVDVPIEVNGSVVTTNPASETWSFEDENAWYKIRGNSDKVEIYNLGVYVCDDNLWGTGGTIVSKKRLKLNFARNDVLHTCPVYKAAIGEFKKRTRHALLEKKAPSAKDVAIILEEMERGRFPIERVMRVPLLKDTNGRRVTPEDLLRRLGERTVFGDATYNYSAFSFDHAKSLKADYAMQSRTWIVFDEDFCAEAFGLQPDPQSYDDLADLGIFLENAVKHVRGAMSEDDRERALASFVPRDELYAQLSFHHETIADENLDRDESAVMTALRRENGKIAKACGKTARHLLVGLADGAEAWTDGERIIIERSFLRRCLKTPHGLLRMLFVLVHEYTHDDDTRTHDPEFDRMFHEAIMRIAPLHTRILATVSNVANGRLITFRKTAALVATGLSRMKLDASNHRDDGPIVPCPGCALLEKKRRYWERSGGVLLRTLSSAVETDEAFEAAFGVRLKEALGAANLKVSDSVNRPCPICETQWFSVANFGRFEVADFKRVCMLAVQSAVAGATTRKEVLAKIRSARKDVTAIQ